MDNFLPTSRSACYWSFPRVRKIFITKILTEGILRCNPRAGKARACALVIHRGHQVGTRSLAPLSLKYNGAKVKSIGLDHKSGSRRVIR